MAERSKLTRRFQLEIIKERVLTEHAMVYTEGPDGRKREMRKVERTIPEGYMVYFHGGHSIFVENKERLAALGLLPELNKLVDTETGEVQDDSNGDTDLKQRVRKRNTDALGRFVAQTEAV